MRRRPLLRRSGGRSWTEFSYVSLSRWAVRYGGGGESNVGNTLPFRAASSSMAVVPLPAEQYN
jgi:hypothetical protein